ncbi:hypothetical protein NSK_003299 [Nannochloropsis salina CCMP1776]|uniref:Carboxypeptidase n=1 Tax=Nannochloropsis salina CCMP1776 TaxID=1027361 RepID=A0A4D9D226_9STRA|nr:hypothetical protein NSK_003299 [Nannochloropsis salina CCMP1776]|eukprot:TFJ85426.1 hypothetical protein NSK_003299 [Nannochloropsis salina CCMP1776]
MACAFLHRLVASVPTISTTIAGPAATTACNFGRGKNVRMFASAAGTVASAVTAQEALSKYEELAKNLREIDALEGISGLLGWDEQTMLPSGSAPARAFHKAALAGVLHEKKTNPSLDVLLPVLASPNVLELLPSPEARANVRLAHKEWELQKKKSKEMTAREAALEGRGYAAWVSAREKDEFHHGFLPVLQDIVALKKEVATATRPGWDTYDANLDLFEPGMTVRRLTEIFGALKTDLVPLLQQIMASSRYQTQDKDRPPAFQGGPQWDVNIQAQLSREVSEALGFDYTLGRIDTSVHPFTGGSHPTDVRITTRYSQEKWLEGISGTVHEVGHGLYEQGRNPEQRDLPASRALSMGGLSPEDFYRHVNRVQPDLIRVEADEVTYPLHIILRFELEQALLDGSLAPADLPHAWNAKMKSLLNVEVVKSGEGREGGREGGNAKGCLQDVHWAVGALGYFPSYTLGAMMAAQLWVSAERAIPSLSAEIGRGNFQKLREWLRREVHVRGSVFTSMDELLRTVTGEPLNPEYFVMYLKRKYGELYSMEEGGKEEL